MSSTKQDRPNLPDQVDNILVATKYRFIGDTLLAVPLLRVIHEKWPAAKIALITGAKAREAVLHCPYISEVIEFDPYRPCDKGIKSYLKLISKLRQHNFDLAFVCNRSFHSALTAALAGATERVGWSGFEGRDFLLTCTTAYDFNASEVSSYLDLFRAVAPGALASSELELWVDSSERDRVQCKLPSSKLLIGLQPGATHVEKQWPVEKYCEFASKMLDTYYDTSFVLVGGPDEKEQANAFLESCAANVVASTINLTGALSLRETFALLTYLQLFLAGDTAIRHCSMALGTPSVALFGPTSIKKWGNAEWPKHIAIASADNQVASITVGEVFAACRDALGLDHPAAAQQSGPRARARV